MRESDLSANVTFTYTIANRWLGMRFDFAILVLAMSTAMFSIFMRGLFPAALLIFSLQIITDVTNNFSIAMRFFAEMQNHLTSAQRIYSYTQLESEDLLTKPKDQEIGQWPSKGQIKFEGVTMSYRPTLEPAVRNLTFEVQSGMKVGIVGRTGSGKSSILQILFRLVDSSEGTIEIDGVDLKSVGLHKLRQSIGYIPQSPFLLVGSVRENLDVFGKRTDDEIW
jgi:ATP-binding cassette subfamily C (CFTR/MRP) protein 1